MKPPPAPLSLDEDNTTRPYAVVSLTAANQRLPHLRAHRGHQIFAGQITLAQPAMIRSRRKARTSQRAHRHPAAPFVCGQRRPNGPQPVENCTPRVLDKGDHPQKHHGASGQTGRLSPQRDRVLPGLYRQCRLQREHTWADENSPTNVIQSFSHSKIPFNRYFLFTRPCILRPDHCGPPAALQAPGSGAEACANSSHSCIWVWIVALSSFCCSSSDSSFSILASALLTSSRKDLFCLKELRRIDQAGHLIQIKLLHRTRRRSTSPRHSSSRIA